MTQYQLVEFVIDFYFAFCYNSPMPYGQYVRKKGSESGQYRHGFALKPKNSHDKKIYDWWKELRPDVPYSIFRRRLFEKRWSFEKAISKPLDHRGLAKTLYKNKTNIDE